MAMITIEFPRLSISDEVRESMLNISRALKNVASVMEESVRFIRELFAKIADNFRELLRSVFNPNEMYSQDSSDVYLDYDFIPNVDFDIAVSTNIEETTHKRDYSLLKLLRRFWPLLAILFDLSEVVNAVNSVITALSYLISLLGF